VGVIQKKGGGDTTQHAQTIRARERHKAGFIGEAVNDSPVWFGVIATRSNWGQGLSREYTEKKKTKQRYVVVYSQYGYCMNACTLGRRHGFHSEVCGGVVGKKKRVRRGGLICRCLWVWLGEAGICGTEDIK